jgi:galactitol-specific phosphotransferase system IIC component
MSCQLCYIGVIAYLISRIIVLSTADTDGKDMMYLFVFVSLSLTSATAICAMICIMNFDRGFKKINESKNNAARESYYLLPTDTVPYQTRYPPRPPSRLIID